MIKIYEENPNERAVAQVVEILKNDGVIVYPTDGVYAFGCSLNSPKAIDKLKAIKNKPANEFSIMCTDLSHIADYARVNNNAFKILKRNLPGRFTFILNASSRVPAKALEKRKTIGIRIADNSISNAITKALGSPLMTSSVKDEDEVLEYTTDPGLIKEKWGHCIDVVVDGGYGNNIPTTLIDLTGDEPLLVREGGGELAL